MSVNCDLMGKDGGYCDDYPTCACTYAGLLVRGGGEEPEEVTALLRVEPTTMRCKRRQDRYSNGAWEGLRPGGMPLRHNGWTLSTQDIVQSRDSRRHVDWLLDSVKGKSAEFAELRARGWSTEISVFWHSQSGHGGPTVGPSSMRIMADLGITLWFDVYDSDPDEEEPDGDQDQVT